MVSKFVYSILNEDLYVEESLTFFLVCYISPNQEFDFPLKQQYHTALKFSYQRLFVLLDGIFSYMFLVIYTKNAITL